MTYNYFCYIVENSQDWFDPITEKDILCEHYKKEYCTADDDYLCPHKKPNIFNLGEDNCG